MMGPQQFLYIVHALMSPANDQDLSKHPGNLYLIESISQELPNAVPDASELLPQLPGGPVGVVIECIK